MASKEEILRAVLELGASLDTRLNTICARLERIERQVTPTLTIEPQGQTSEPEVVCEKCLHSDGTYVFGDIYCASRGCFCQAAFHRNEKQRGCPECGHDCGRWGLGIICADVSKFNSSMDGGNLNDECRCTNPYHRAYKTPLTD